MGAQHTEERPHVQPPFPWLAARRSTRYRASATWREPRAAKGSFMRNRIHGGIAAALSLAYALGLTACQGGGSGEGNANEAMGSAGANSAADAGPTNAGSGNAGNTATAGGGAGGDGTAATGGMIPTMMGADGGTDMMPIDMMPRNALPMPTPNDPTDPTGAISGEGSPCDSDSFPCPDDLVCHAESSISRGACARSCIADDECAAEEVCGTFDGLNGICLALVGAWEYFSLPARTICEEDLVPIAVADVPPTGWCIPVCELPDSPAPADAADILMECSGTATCSDVLGLASADGSNRLGSCATTVARGEVCDDLLGILCEDQLSDLCAPADPMNIDGELRCAQYCDSTIPCDEGTCTPLILDGVELFSYCL
jgi:hypothetical protein